ncbi:MAG TPA: hypothetical protein EYP68_08430 [Candidatus Korarchaeota archaeon]|nr:hypothetical protein [Candidatus Korarchaeota archaeon]
MVKIGDLLEKVLKTGEIVELEGKVSELLPVFALGTRRYERIVISDDTGQITLVLPSSPKYFLPGDLIKLRGRVRPCPYVPSEVCIETSADDIEILNPKWIRPEDRKELDDLGAFTLFAFLAVTTLDEKKMEPILKTKLESTKIYEEVRKKIELGEDVNDFMEILEAMTLYSVFFRSLSAAEATRNSVIMIKGLDIEKEVRSRLDVMEKFLKAVVDVEGFRPYILSPKTGLIETYPLGTEEELRKYEELFGPAMEVVKSLRGEGDLRFMIIQLEGSLKELEKVRKVIEVAAGAGGASLLTSTIDTTLEKFQEVIEQLMRIPERRERAILYIEGLEILTPSDLFISTFVKDPNVALKVRGRSLDLLSKILENPLIVLVAVTPSIALVDKKVVEKADRVVGEAKKIKKGEGFIPYTA